MYHVAKIREDHSLQCFELDSLRWRFAEANMSPREIRSHLVFGAYNVPLGRILYGT